MKRQRDAQGFRGRHEQHHALTVYALWIVHTRHLYIGVTKDPYERSKKHTWLTNNPDIEGQLPAYHLIRRWGKPTSEVPGASFLFVPSLRVIGTEETGFRREAQLLKEYGPP